MITSVDSSSLFAVFKREKTASAVLDLFMECTRDGEMVVSEIAFAEVSSLAPNAGAIEARLQELNIRLLRSTTQTLFRAGEIFRNYRLEGGRRGFLLPDFLVAAHAEQQTDRLIANDRGYLRSYFPKLKILTPPR